MAALALLVRSTWEGAPAACCGANRNQLAWLGGVPAAALLRSCGLVLLLERKFVTYLWVWLRPLHCSSLAANVTAAVGRLRERHPNAPVYVSGHRCGLPCAER